jgi:protein-disulfide isomerase
MTVQNSIQKKLSLKLGTTTAIVGTFFMASACTGVQATPKPNVVHKDSGKPGVVAKVGGEEITEDMLIGEDKMDFFELKKREYELKMNQLNKLMVDKLIGSEAKKAGMSIDDFVNKKIIKSEVKISDKDYKKFVADKKIPESQLNPQIKERIISYMQGAKKQEMIQEYIGKLTKSEPVEVYFHRPKLMVNVDQGAGPWAGGEKAPVTVVEFSDFQCPFCSRAADTVGDLKKKYGDKVKVVFRHFPLPMHKDARGAAEASMCVNEQGSAKFWKYHDLLFKNQDKLDNASLEKFAKDAGADTKKFKECFDSKKFAAAVQKDMEYGEKVGVKSTPTFFINGELISGALPLEAFSESIDEQLSAMRK